MSKAEILKADKNGNLILKDYSSIPTDYQSFIHQSRYSRLLQEEGRRETWEETVTRLLDFYKTFLKTNHDYDLPK